MTLRGNNTLEYKQVLCRKTESQFTDSVKNTGTKPYFV